MRTTEGLGRLMVVTTGWYGLGHITPITAILEKLREQSNARISLFTLPFEVPRLQRRSQSNLFDAIYVGADGEGSDYQEYIIRNHFENRVRFHHAFHIERPSVLLFHWMMLVEPIDVACLSQCRVVALLEENEWGDVIPGSANVRYFAFVDEVIFCDSLRSDDAGLRPRQYRVGCVTDFAYVEDERCRAQEFAASLGLPANVPLVVINTAAGTYQRTHRYIKQLLSLCAQRSDLGFLIMIGPLVPESLRSQTRATACRLPNLAVVCDPAREQIRQFIKCADVVIHSGGISSTAECIAMRKKFLVVNPNGSDHENDVCRIRELVRKGMCNLLETGEDSSIGTLSQAIDHALLSDPCLAMLPANGAARAATLIKSWLETPVNKAVSNRSALVCLFAPDVDSSVRLNVKHLVPPGWHYMAVDLPDSAVDCSLSAALEMDRCHQVVASLCSYKEVLFFAVIGTNPIYDKLLHYIQLDREILAVSLRPISLDSRFLCEVAGDSLPHITKEIERLLKEPARWFTIRPPAPEHEDYVEAKFSPFRTTR